MKHLSQLQTAGQPRQARRLPAFLSQRPRPGQQANQALDFLTPVASTHDGGQILQEAGFVRSRILEIAAFRHHRFQQLQRGARVGTEDGGSLPRVLSVTGQQVSEGVKHTGTGKFTQAQGELEGDAGRRVPRHLHQPGQEAGEILGEEDGRFPNTGMFVSQSFSDDGFLQGGQTFQSIEGVEPGLGILPFARHLSQRGKSGPVLPLEKKPLGGETPPLVRRGEMPDQLRCGGFVEFGAKVRAGGGIPRHDPVDAAVIGPGVEVEALLDGLGDGGRSLHILAANVDNV